MMSAQLYEYSDSSEEEPNNIQNQPQSIQSKIHNAENFRKQNNNNKFNNLSSSKPKPSVNKALNSPQPLLPPPSQINLHSNTFAQSQNSNNSSSQNKKIDIRSCYDNIEYSDEEDISSNNNNNEHKYNDNQLNSNHRYNKPRPTRRTPQTTPNDINNDFPKLFQHSYISSAFNPWDPSNWKDKTKGYYILNKPGGLGVSHTNDKPYILDLTNKNDRGRGRGRGGRGRGRGRGRGWRGRGRGNSNRYGDNNRGYISHRDRGYNKYHDFGYNNNYSGY